MFRKRGGVWFTPNNFMIASQRIKDYFEQLQKETNNAYTIAKSARSKGFDPEGDVNIPLAANMAERVVGLISLVAPSLKQSNIPERIIELEKQYGLLDWRVGLKIAEEVVHGSFCTFKNREEAMDIAIRVGFAYLTLGIVAAPLEGFIGLKIKKRADGGDYLSVCYAGPIRGAGGTAAATSVILADYVRTVMGVGVYDPTEDEISRCVIEIHDYHERITNLQYHPSDDEIKFLAKHIPVEINGDPTEEIEVSNYKDLPRIETNRIRGGICLVLAEGISQKAPKLWLRLNQWGKDFQLNWDFLGQFLELQKKVKAQTKESTALLTPNYTYIADLVAGRPVLGLPMRNGGFRLRYGRTHVSGFSSVGLHPATLAVLSNYIAIGTQLKMERPGKAATVTLCDSIEPPIVKLADGSVMTVTDPKQAKQLPVVEILYLGDILISYGDFSENGHKLVPAGYCEEWWVLEFEKAAVALFGTADTQKIADAVGIEQETIATILQNPLSIKPSFACARQLSEKLNIPLHPSYTYFWNSITIESFKLLREWLRTARLEYNNTTVIKLVLPFGKHHLEAKRALELLGVPHLVVSNEFVVIENDHAACLSFCLNIQSQATEQAAILDMLKSLCSITIRDKCGVFIGARMGRPEKAKMRKLTGSPHILFPVGDEGERMRSFQSALSKKKITADFALFHCNSCKAETIYSRCPRCGDAAQPQYTCRECGQSTQQECSHGKKKQYKKQPIDIGFYWSNALAAIGLDGHATLMKGVRGTSNEAHVVEHLAKGILRSKHDVYVNKDGTIRYDMTELPMTHFKPKEIGTSIEKLRELGYITDVFGKPLEHNDQILELFVQDIVLPLNENALDESSKKVLYRISKFIDELLVRLYKLEPYYNLKKEEDIIGHLVIGLAPHISAGLIGRIIGFTGTQGCFAHPMWHAGLRRDCVYPTTRFVVNDKNGYNYERIGPFVEHLIHTGSKTTPIDSVGTIKIELQKPLFALGIDPTTKKMKPKKIKYFIKGPREKKWIKITTATNRTLTMTPGHDFMFMDKTTFNFKKARDIKIGDKLPLLLKSDEVINPITSINLIEEFVNNLPEKPLKNIFVKNESFFRQLVKNKSRDKIIKYMGKNYRRNLHRWYKSTPLSDVKALLKSKIISVTDIPRNTTIRVKYSSYHHSIHFPITSSLASLLGYYSAEGYCRQNKTVSQVAFRIADKEIQKEIISLIQKVFGLRANLGENSTKITICDQLVYNLFRHCFKAGSNAYTKRVPSLLLNTSNNTVAAYLSAFIDGDGSIIPPNNSVALYSVSRELLDDIALLFTRFSIFSKFHTTPLRSPGKHVLDIYRRLGKTPKQHTLHHLIINGNDAPRLSKVLHLKSIKKNQRLLALKQRKTDRRTSFHGKQYPMEQLNDVIIDYVKKVEVIASKEHSYCMEVDWKTKEDRNVLWGEQIINTRCDGDECCFMLLLDGLLNFSRQYLPNQRGAKTMDSPLVLTSVLIPSEVDDQSHGLDVQWHYPLQLYEAAQQYKSARDVKIDQIKHRLNTEKQYEQFGFTHPVSNLNSGVKCSAYKTILAMDGKLKGQMEIAEKIRAVDASEVARLVIEKHFIKDIKGNLRRFSTQQFRCVNCNESCDRPPLRGVCSVCGGKIIFTVTQGSIIKYLQPSLYLAKQYNLSNYLSQTLEIVRRRIEGVFGQDREKQAGLQGWVQEHKG